VRWHISSVGKRARSIERVAVALYLETQASRRRGAVRVRFIIATWYIAYAHAYSLPPPLRATMLRAPHALRAASLPAAALPAATALFCLFHAPRAPLCAHRAARILRCALNMKRQRGAGDIFSAGVLC